MIGIVQYRLEDFATSNATTNSTGSSMRDLEQDLRSIALAPYIVKAMALIGVSGKAGINAFRHQMYTMSILLDYKFSDPVLLKASVVHDLFEDALGLPGVSREVIEHIDSDGPAV